jgi:mannitol/fructose-specific phosphotransferase system IIA component (Ntr-type)
LYSLISNRLHDPDIIVRSGVACLSVKIKGRRKFELLMVRNKEGIQLSEDSQKVIALFIVAYSDDEWNYQIHALSRIINIVENPEFLEKWNNAGSGEELSKTLLSLNRETNSETHTWM